MTNSTPRSIARADYQPATHAVEKMHLQFELDATATRVKSVMTVRSITGAGGEELMLDGCELHLVEVKIDGCVLDSSAYTLEPVEDPTTLRIHAVPALAVIAIETLLNPQSNTALEGLYLSSGNFCTQCEAEGFRRITFYPDRPDVMTRFSVKIVAEKFKYPVLLSNGNETSRGDLDDGRHWSVWEDPWPKPSYLFALVAGSLSKIDDRFTTASGRNVDLSIYVQKHNIDKCEHAMASLRLAMRWDEEVFGLEYDLDRYMIVAVDDFNMGAMENKGLNIFNSKYVLADQATATDTDYLGIESVIAHEYFHNWTGNRVTCRDWFQLSLKEGLTVFRDQEFSADQHSRAVKRIEDVRLLRARQFPEDAGPMAHPVRPESYIEINNFYTLTIYEKGAEVIRMLHTLVGAEDFRAGMDLYFNRHDGQAVTCEDFVLCMEAASGLDLQQFRLWYSQSGTPRLAVHDSYDADRCVYTLHVTQSLPLTRDQQDVQPMHIPFAISLFGQSGQPLPIVSDGSDPERFTRVIDVTETSQEFHFTGVQQNPVPSLLRGFSAPVILDYDYSEEKLAFLLTHDTDAFNRWEAGQRLVTRAIDCFSEADGSHHDMLIDAYKMALRDKTIDSAFKAELLLLPGIETISEGHGVFNVDRLAANKNAVEQRLAEALEEEMAQCVRTTPNKAFAKDTEAMGLRALNNICLRYLSRLPDHQWISQVRDRFCGADNMTDQIAALGILLEFDQRNSPEYLTDFYRRWNNERLVVDKWFSIQATANVANVLDTVEELLRHPEFDLGNPNRVRSLLGAFSNGNPVAFHRSDGRGYQLISEQVIQLDDINPQVAARLVTPLTRWQRMGVERQSKMKTCLLSISAKTDLSADVFEVVNSALDR